MTKKRQAHFQRTKLYAYACLGKYQKSKRKYRHPKGRHNKTRQKWRSRPPRVEIGYKNEVKTSGLVNGKIPMMINNVKDLAMLGKNNIAIIAKLGKKNKIEIAREAEKKKIEIYNLNVRKLLKKFDKQNKK
jgi:large subunit ribosomal protein L32e